MQDQDHLTWSRRACSKQHDASSELVWACAERGTCTRFDLMRRTADGHRVRYLRLWRMRARSECPWKTGRRASARSFVSRASRALERSARRRPAPSSRALKGRDVSSEHFFSFARESKYSQNDSFFSSYGTRRTWCPK